MAYIGFHIICSHSKDDVYLDWVWVAFHEVLCFQILEDGKWIDVQEWLHRIDPADPKIKSHLPNLTRKLDIAENPMMTFTDKDFGKIKLDDDVALEEFCKGMIDNLKTEYTILPEQLKAVSP